MAGPLSPFRPTVSATNDLTRLGFQFCQPSEVRPLKTFTAPLANTLPMIVGNHGRGGECRQRLPPPLAKARHTADGWKSLDTEQSAYVGACR